MAESLKNRDIRNIFIVLGAAVASAAILALGFLYYYSPSGRYLAGNVLLDPLIIDQIHYQDLHPETGKKVKFAFDQIEFSYFDSEQRQVKKFPVSLDVYLSFYQRVGSEKSLEQVVTQIQNLFIQSQPALLTMSMRTKERGENGTMRMFQVVQLIPEGYFRVQLHEKKEGEWVYFYQRGLYQESIRLFNSSN